MKMQTRCFHSFVPVQRTKFRGHVFGYNHHGHFWVEPGADKSQTSIYWADHVFEEHMPGYNDSWTNPKPISVPELEDFGVEYRGLHKQPPGAYAGVNRPWVGFKPSRWVSGYFGSGLAIRDSWGPDLEQRHRAARMQAKPEVLLDRVSVDFFLDEFSIPLNKHNSVMASARQKHTMCLRINTPQWDNTLDMATSKTLFWEVWESTFAVGRRITMIGACQNGKTEWWCRGLPHDLLATRMRWHTAPPAEPALEGDDTGEVKRLADTLQAWRNTPNEEAELSEVAASGVLHRATGDGVSTRLLHRALKQARWENKLESIQPSVELEAPSRIHDACMTVRWGLRAIWALGNGDSPTISFVNGKAANVGAGLALLCTYAALRDQAEIYFSGVQQGHTPIGGLLRLLCDKAVEVKYPHLAEYMVLTNSPICNGEAKRLGWTAVHAPTDTHLNERMLQDYLNMHPYHDAGDSRRILFSALFNDNDHDPAMDRCAITAPRARWIHECFSATTVADIERRLREAAESKTETDVEYTELEVDGKPVERSRVTKAEWAAGMLQVMERASPLAKAVSLHMVQHARANSLNLPDAMALEYRCFVRMMRQPDFQAGCRKHPKWAHQSNDEVPRDLVASIVEDPLTWEADHTVELNLPIECFDMGSIEKSCEVLGVELVDGLGTNPALAAEDRASLPRNINVYREARHPTTGVVGSARDPAPPAEQARHRREVEEAARKRLDLGEGRTFNWVTDSAPDGTYTPTDTEAARHEGQKRWHAMRLAAEKASGSPSYTKSVEHGVDLGGERIFSPGAEDTPFAARKEPVYGHVPKYNVNVLSHFYNPRSPLPPRGVRNWDALEQYANSQKEKGRSDEDVLDAVSNMAF